MSIAYENSCANGAAATAHYVDLDGQRYCKISDSHEMPEFFMSLVGPSDHWMFISSTGALTCGRQNADNALFPYGTDDRISQLRHTTGSTTLIRAATPGQQVETWEPFQSTPPLPAGIRRNVYKTPIGSQVVFEEVNEDQKISFRYRWAFSEKFGFVRTCQVRNIGDHPQQVCVLDGLSNLLPYGVNSDFMARFSNLANAYRTSELVEGTDLALFLLSSIPTDRAEPSEGLRATTVWETGVPSDVRLLSRDQVSAFRNGVPLTTETDVRGKPGAFLVQKTISLAPGEDAQWHIVAELAQDHTETINLNNWLENTVDPAQEIEQDIQASHVGLERIVASADAMQLGDNVRRSDRHQANTVFNVMRGGIPLQNYTIESDDFVEHVGTFNRALQQEHSQWLRELPAELPRADLVERAKQTGDPDLQRLATEYLPLAFSRRHGDPTRPWNRFSIDLRRDDGRTSLNYQGNWRDIFQNWEALAVSFPEFATSMICRFVNATTADGYNPYRVTKDGFEWEEPTPEDPWANIGYWGDHQIIYLLRLLEMSDRVAPQELDQLLGERSFVHANVPYRIKPFSDIRQDPHDTITFDSDLASKIARRVSEIGSDGKLVLTRSGEVHRVTLLEKLLTLSLAKLTNYVPDGGIWLNTQRPEWNDANNALVGNGLSMVTACYMHRWFTFIENWISKHNEASFSVSQETAAFLMQIAGILRESLGLLDSPLKAEDRGRIVAALCEAGSDYRKAIYDDGLSGKSVDVSGEQVLELARSASRHLRATIEHNRRTDGLFHSYNLIEWSGDEVNVEHLYEMLEGQVAVLSAGVLTPAETVELLDALRSSALYRENQLTYMLYPDRRLPRFLEKNTLTREQVSQSPLIQKLIADGDQRIVRKDIHGGVHFAGDFRNSSELRTALLELPSHYQAQSEVDLVCSVFEDMFQHRQFTGRSGTFFAYEGLGSIYWHMVSKLGLAVVENFFDAVNCSADATVIEALREHYQAIRKGIGAEKCPADYGAFPSDPYSHTPENAGVKQPGMTGQVKEDVLARFLEVGAHVQDGQLSFRLDLFDADELLDESQEFTYYDVGGNSRCLPVSAGGFAFTLCQVPVVYSAGETDEIIVRFADDSYETVAGRQLSRELTRKLFSRSGQIRAVECRLQGLS